MYCLLHQKTNKTPTKPKTKNVLLSCTRTFLGCKWHGFQDTQSGLDFYEWRLGTTPGGDDILTPRYAALEEVAFLTLTNTTTMPTGREMFCTVRVYDKAGMEKFSNSLAMLLCVCMSMKGWGMKPHNVHSITCILKKRFVHILTTISIIIICK